MVSSSTFWALPRPKVRGTRSTSRQIADYTPSFFATARTFRQGRASFFLDDLMSKSGVSETVF
jgi:hypothetical protein